MPETHKSFCRFCHVFCGVEVDVEDGRVVAVRGDRENPVTEGYTCLKGRAEPERIHHPERVTAPLKRAGDGFEEIAPQDALDEIAERLGDIVSRHGPDAVAVYVGCGGHRTSVGGPWFVRRWLDALGSQRLYTSFTIDSPSLGVAGQRFFGSLLPTTLLDVERAECVMFVGSNPAASHQLNMPQSSPSARIRAAQRRGAKLIVVDPRRSDVARWADFHLQVKPGEDATLLAGMVKIVLDRGLQDHEYVDRYVSGVAELHAALAPFDLAYVEHRSGVPASLVEEAAVAFATAPSGGAQSGTGMHMAAHHNLATSLVMTLNGLCGRYDRPGGLNRTEGPLGRRFDASMGPPPAGDPPKSRIRGIPAMPGLFGAYYEMPTNTLTDEILTPGEGQVRALIVNGGNPALVFSNEPETRRALESLELLVVSDLFVSATAAHADYVMATKHPFERPDVPKLMDATYPFEFSQYTPAIVEGPEGCLEEWEVFWELARRLELPLRVGGLDARSDRPTSDEMLDASFSRSRVPMEELRRHPSGWTPEDRTPEGPTSQSVAPQGRTTTAGGVIPNMIGHPDRRMAVGHPEVLAELRVVASEFVPTGAAYEADADFDFRLITYRMKEVYCSQGQRLPSLREKRPYNPTLMHPDAMARLGVRDGDLVEIASDHGRVEGIVEASRDLRPDVIALAFGWGDPSDPRGVREKGSNVQRLIPADRRYDPVTGLALQSAIPVNVTPLPA